MSGSRQSRRESGSEVASRGSRASAPEPGDRIGLAELAVDTFIAPPSCEVLAFCDWLCCRCAADERGDDRP